MNTSDSIKNIAEALKNFQSDVGAVHKDATNPFHKSKYATLLSYINASTEPMAKHGLSIVQGGTRGCTELSCNELATRLMHVSGEWIEVYTPMVWDKPTMQNVGSALSYARRYGWAAVLGLTASDDDGNKATGVYEQEYAAPQVAPAMQTPRASPEYVFQYLKKFKGTALGDLDQQELKNYCTWARSQEKPPQGNFLKEIEVIEGWLGQ